MWTLLILLAVFGAIVGGVILAKKYLKPFQNDDKPKSAEETAQDEVNRILEDVTDEETASQISSYKQEESKEDKEGEDKPIF